MVLFRMGFPDIARLRLAAVAIAALQWAAVAALGREKKVSPIHRAMASYMFLNVLALWVWPLEAGRLVTAHPATALYTVLFAAAAGPPLLAREPFTFFFARRRTPRELWTTSLFRQINNRLAALWAGLFLRILEGTCTCHDGPADDPGVVVKTPADAWLAISRGELDGRQAFLSGRYGVEGDIPLLPKLPRLFERIAGSALET